MNKLLFFISMLFVFPQALYAQNDADLDALCRYYTTHTADADVEYQDGFDVRGDDVVSAELDDNRIELPRVFHIPLHVEQLEALNLPTDSVLTPELAVGEVVVDIDTNMVTFNGKPIKRQDLEVLCLKPNYEKTGE